MKKTLLIGLALSYGMVAYSQGWINFSTSAQNNPSPPGNVYAPVYLHDPGDPLTRISGNTSAGSPSGSTVYNGAAVLGTHFVGELWGGPAGSTEAQLVHVASTPMWGSPAPAFLVGCVTPAGTPGVPGVPAGSTATFQLRVFDSTGLPTADWATVNLPQYDQTNLRGYSDLFTVPYGLGSATITPPNLAGLESFTVNLVPEPSAIALGVLGLGALVLFRRRK